MADLEHVAAIFRVLANPIRLRIVAELAAPGRAEAPSVDPCVSDIATRLEISRFTASFHLKELCAAGVAVRHRSGRRWSHRLTDEVVNTIDEWLFDLPPLPQALPTAP